MLSNNLINKYSFEKEKKINIKLRYLICISVCQVLNGKRSIFDMNEWCEIPVWRKINRFINLNKKYEINIHKSEFIHHSNKVKIICDHSMITIKFNHNKINDFKIINILKKNNK